MSTPQGQSGGGCPVRLQEGARGDHAEDATVGPAVRGSEEENVNQEEEATTFVTWRFGCEMCIK